MASDVRDILARRGSIWAAQFGACWNRPVLFEEREYSMRLNLSNKSLTSILAIVLVLSIGTTLTLAQGSGYKREATIVTVSLTGSLSGVHAGSGAKRSQGPVFTIHVAKGATGEDLKAYAHWKLKLVDGPETRNLLAQHADGKAVQVRGRLDVDRRVLYVLSFTSVDEG